MGLKRYKPFFSAIGGGGTGGAADEDKLKRRYKLISLNIHPFRYIAASSLKNLKSRSKLKKTKADNNNDKVEANSESEVPDDPEETSKVPKEKKVGF